MTSTSRRPPVDVQAEPLRALVDRSDTGVALRCPEDRATTSFPQLEETIARLAGQLAAAGVERGDRAALVLGNGPEIVELVLALGRLGAAAAPLNPAYTAPEYAFFLGDIGPKLLITAPGDAPAAREAAADLPLLELAAGERGPSLHRGGRLIKESAEQAGGGAAEDVALILHTSGTTSRPKQVPLLQRNIVASARALAAHYELGPDDVSYCAMPLFHVHGLIGSALSAIGAGGSVVLPRRFSARSFWQTAGASGVSWVSASPTHHHAIVSQPVRGPLELRFARSCSAALHQALATAAEEAYDAPVLQAYGMTEASHQVSSNPLPPAMREATAVGVSAGARFRVIDEAWRAVPDGAAGEVAIAGPGLTPGYIGNDEANAAAFRDGWFRTGDRGYVRNGLLHLDGRLKELINRGGEKISPAEIDEALCSHDAVAEAVAFGVPDERLGEAVEAAVVTSGVVSEEELIAHCRRSLAPFKLPRRIHRVAALPRTATGKVQRHAVAASIAHADR
jgi:acyl-CoA synthetase (AMP-forming)/AMP-acid ligase II